MFSDGADGKAMPASLLPAESTILALATDSKEPLIRRSALSPLRTPQCRFGF